MLTWVLYSGLLLANAPVPASFSLQCTDMVQLPVLAQRLVIDSDLRGKLDWSPSSFQQTVGLQQPVTLQFHQAGDLWKLSIEVGNNPDHSALMSYFFGGVTVLNGDDGELLIFTDEGQFKGLQHGGQFDVFNDHRALDLMASDWGIERSTKDGCTFSWQDMPSAISRLNGSNVALNLPYALSEVSVQYQHPSLSLPDLNSGALSTLEPVKSAQQPIAVLQLLSSPIDLLRDDRMPDNLRMTDIGFAMLHRKLRIPGAQVGLFSLNKTEPDLLAVIPIAKKSKEKPVNARRIWRWLKRLSKRSGWELEEVAAFTGEMRQGERTLFVRTIDGELHLATQAKRLDTLQPDGQPWKVSEVIHGRPLSLTVSLPQMMALSLGGVSQVQVGLSIENNTVSSVLSAVSLNGQSGLVPLLSIVGQRLPVSDKESEPLGAVPSNMQALSLYSHQLYAKTGHFQAMDVFPASDVHPLKDAEPLVSSNGWAPEMPLVGQYWVEITNEGQGFNIHGLQDNGTGEQTHWVMDEKGKLSTLTSKD